MIRLSNHLGVNGQNDTVNKCLCQQCLIQPSSFLIGTPYLAIIASTEEADLLDGFEVILLVAVMEVPSIVKPFILPSELSEDLSVSVT